MVAPCRGAGGDAPDGAFFFSMARQKLWRAYAIASHPGRIGVANSPGTKKANGFDKVVQCVILSRRLGSFYRTQGSGVINVLVSGISL